MDPARVRRSVRSPSARGLGRWAPGAGRAFLPAVEAVARSRPFLVLGQRWDLDIEEAIDFERPGWEAELRESVDKLGRLHSHLGVDYFVFSKQLWPQIPPFAIGRMYYDRWLIAKARVLGARVIDATERVTCVHQNHERTYATVGLQGPPGETLLRRGSEARRNLELAGGKRNLFSVRDSDWLYDRHGLRRAQGWLTRVATYLRAQSSSRGLAAIRRSLMRGAKKVRSRILRPGRRSS